MTQRHDDREPLIFDDEPEVTYEPPNRRAEGSARSAGSSAGLAVAGAGIGTGLAAGGSLLADAVTRLDIFQSASAQAAPGPSGDLEAEEDLTAPIDFSAGPESQREESSLDDLMHGAEAEVGGGHTLDEFDAFDPNEAIGELDDLDFASDEEDLAGDLEDDLDFE